MTFLFTDIVGSTTLLHAVGPDRFAWLLADHRRALREVFAANGGVEVDTQGDAFFVAFGSAAGAVTAASQATAALGDGAVQVRIGVHTGEPLVTDEGYVGIDVHRAARIAGVANGHQVLVSSTTRSVLGPDMQLRDLGQHRLKDLVEPERLFQLGNDEFPPLRTLFAANLPVDRGPLVGRERELDQLRAMLDGGSRLVTVTGPGGSGKTRLVTQFAADQVGRFADGVFWIPLAALADPGLVEAAVAQGLGAPDELIPFLAGRQVLVVLDNMEHLLESAPLVSSMLASGTGVQVIATSTTPMRLAGEREFHLAPLPVKDAARLFALRAGTAGRDVEVDATIEAICDRLDGLPLAVELAAGRTRLLTPERLLERLDQALPLLTGGARDAPERQRTMLATIQWSVDLLDQPTRSLLARLSVFTGSFPLDAAEAVANATLDELGILVETSLLTTRGDERFRMLRTVREHAADLLSKSNEADELRRRNALHWARLAERAYTGRDTSEAQLLTLLELEHDNLRAALDEMMTASPDQALSLAGALGWFWLARGHLVEGRERLVAALAGSSLTGRERTRALTAAGPLAARLGDAAVGRRELADAIEGWRYLGETAELAAALDALGWILFFDSAANEEALAAFEEEAAICRETGDYDGETRSMSGIGQMLVVLGEVERAETLALELIARAGDDLRASHFGYHFLADCSLLRGDCAQALPRYLDSLAAALSLGDLVETSFEVQGVAMSLAGTRNGRDALVLGGAVEALWESLGVSFDTRFWLDLLELYIGQARRDLGAAGDLAWSLGRATSFDDAVRLAQASASPTKPLW